MDTPRPFLPPENDIGLLCMVISNGFTQSVLETLAEEGFGDAKFSHGFIVQGLLAGDRSVTELASRLGISIQAVSKTVQEMESLGYIDRTRSPEDGRASLLALSDRAQASLAHSRRARLEVERRLEGRLGPERTAATLEALRDLAAEFGGLEAMAGRRLRPV